MELAASPVKQAALALALPIAQPEKIKLNTDFRAALEAIAPEAIIIVGYGRIVPRWMLDLPQHGNINLHASLLPKYRGAAPIQWAIARGERTTGNTTMRIDEGLDTGDILLQREMAIADDDTSVTLAPRLAAMGAELLVETVAALAAGGITPRPQNHAEATLAPILTREDGRVDFTRTAAETVNRLRGFQPWPAAFTTFRTRQLTLHAIQLATTAPKLAPGEIAARDGHIFAGCGDHTAIEILALQPEGKRRVTAIEWINGYQPKPGERLGE